MLTNNKNYQPSWLLPYLKSTPQQKFNFRMKDGEGKMRDFFAYLPSTNEFYNSFEVLNKSLLEKNRQLFPKMEENLIRILSDKSFITKEDDGNAVLQREAIRVFLKDVEGHQIIDTKRIQSDPFCRRFLYAVKSLSILDDCLYSRNNDPKYGGRAVQSCLHLGIPNREAYSEMYEYCFPFSINGYWMGYTYYDVDAPAIGIYQARVYKNTLSGSFTKIFSANSYNDIWKVLLTATISDPLAWLGANEMWNTAPNNIASYRKARKETPVTRFIRSGSGFSATYELIDDIEAGAFENYSYFGGNGGLIAFPGIYSWLRGGSLNIKNNSLNGAGKNQILRTLLKMGLFDIGKLKKIIGPKLLADLETKKNVGSATEDLAVCAAFLQLVILIVGSFEDMKKRFILFRSKPSDEIATAEDLLISDIFSCVSLDTYKRYLDEMRDIVEDTAKGGSVMSFVAANLWPGDLSEPTLMLNMVKSKEDSTIGELKKQGLSMLSYITGREQVYCAKLDCSDVNETASEYISKKDTRYYNTFNTFLLTSYSKALVDSLERIGEFFSDEDVLIPPIYASETVYEPDRIIEESQFTRKLREHKKEMDRKDFYHSALYAAISNNDSGYELASFQKEKREWFSSYGLQPNTIDSEFRRDFLSDPESNGYNPDLFEEMYLDAIGDTEYIYRKMNGVKEN